MTFDIFYRPYAHGRTVQKATVTAKSEEKAKKHVMKRNPKGCVVAVFEKEAMKA